MQQKLVGVRQAMGWRESDPFGALAGRGKACGVASKFYQAELHADTPTGKLVSLRRQLRAGLPLQDRQRSGSFSIAFIPRAQQRPLTKYIGFHKSGELQERLQGTVGHVDMIAT